MSAERGFPERVDPAREWPDWLVVRIPADGSADSVDGLLRDLSLHTVCEEASCPNIWECYNHRTSTFLIMGDTCTRHCAFCGVRHVAPRTPAAPVDPDEPAHVAEAARRLGLKHVVITSVTRDDLSDGGAGIFAACVDEIRRVMPGATVEVLVPDFRGDRAALDKVLAAAPDVFNHNIETVPRLYSKVRPQAEYRRSLDALAAAAAAGLTVKSGLMLGLGETTAEVGAVLRDLHQAGCRLVTIGQYLRPSPHQLPVARFVPPEEFTELEKKALALGFTGVASGPLVRSSYRAAEMRRLAAPETHGPSAA
ncbi:MAG: lipoyl synthase [Bacillota bacterium]